MKKYIVNLAIAVLALGSITACSEWNEAEAIIDPVTTPGIEGDRSPEYYAALRDWKYNTKHPRSFGWFGNWTGKGSRGENRLMGLPDSVDFVSMWGNWWGLSPEQMADKKAAKDIKGLRVKVCFIIANIGDQTTPKWVRTSQWDPEEKKDIWKVNDVKYYTEQDAVNAFWGWPLQKELEEYDSQGKPLPPIPIERLEAGLRKYANSIIDTIIKYDFDGFDFDLERDYGASGALVGSRGRPYNPQPERMTVFFDEMSKHFGPKSGTDRLLCCDGQPNILDPKCAEMLDFFIMQAYYASSYQDLEGQGYTPRVIPVINHYKDYFTNEMGYGADAEREIVSRIILCEDFEQNAAAGGRAGTFTTRDGRKLPPCWGMADYHTANGHQIGGAGLFHMEYDYNNTYGTIQEIHKDKGMNLDPAKHTGTTCYGYLNGMISLLHTPAKQLPQESVE